VAGQKASGKNSTAGPQSRSTTRKVLRTAFHPELGQSFKQLGNSFGMFLQLLAMLFVSNGMLDRNHRFLKPDAKFTIGDLFNETFAQLDWRDKTKLPQTMFFIAVWGIVTASALWLAMAVFSLIIGVNPAHAAGTVQPSMFVPQTDDLGSRYIDNLFFGKSLIAGGPDITAIQDALRSMLAVFSQAMLIFGSFILLYHIINMVVKAAWEGKALQGAGEIWAPLRLVLAIGMLVPLGQNLNAAQHIVIHIGKMGSALASYAWVQFQNSIDLSADSKQNFVTEKDVSDVFRNMIFVHACKADINKWFDKNYVAALAGQAGAALQNCTNGLGVANGYCFNGVKLGDRIALWSNRSGLNVGDSSLNAPQSGPLVNASLSKNFVTQYGEFSNKDLCGEVTWAKPSSSNSKPRDTLISAAQKTIGDNAATLEVAAAQIAKQLVEDCYKQSGGDKDSTCSATAGDIDRDDINNKIKTALDAYGNKVNQDLTAAIQNYITAAKSQTVNAASSGYGWANAGAYFMELAGIQGSIAEALQVQPTARRGPLFNRQPRPENFKLGVVGALWNDMAGSMNVPVRYAEKHQDHFVNHVGFYSEMLSVEFDGTPIGANKANGTRSMAAFSKSKPAGADTSTDIWAAIGKMIVIDKSTFTNMFAKQGGNPFGALFSFGQTLYHWSLGLLAGGVVGKMSFGIPVAGPVIAAVGSLAFLLGMYLFVPAIWLAFLLPIIPATKFLIGVFSWLGALMEAVIGMPLFALAHLNPQGDSLIAPAKQGYSYLFSIMLKPLFIVFGIIAAVLLSTIGIFILNTMYDIALSAMWGDGDVFVVTAVIFAGMYAFQAYGVCNACFKVIDHLPDRIYQWFVGQSGYNMHDYDDNHLNNPIAGALIFQNAAKSFSGGIDSLFDRGRKGVEQQKQGNEALRNYISNGGAMKDGKVDRESASFKNLGRDQRKAIDLGEKGSWAAGGMGRLSGYHGGIAADAGHSKAADPAKKFIADGNFSGRDIDRDSQAYKSMSSFERDGLERSFDMMSDDDRNAAFKAGQKKVQESVAETAALYDGVLDENGNIDAASDGWNSMLPSQQREFEKNLNKADPEKRQILGRQMKMARDNKAAEKAEQIDMLRSALTPPPAPSPPPAPAKPVTGYKAGDMAGRGPRDKT